MKKLCISLFVLLSLSLLSLNLGVTLELREKLKDNPTSKTEEAVLRTVNSAHLQGYQQRTILITRILVLEHVHGIHAGAKIPMCPGCQSTKPQEIPRQNLTATKK